MGIEDMYERRMRQNEFDGYDKDAKPSKKDKTPTKFKVGDKVKVKGEDGKTYLKGKIISMVKDMAIEGEIVKYSDYIRYPVGEVDIWMMKRDGTRNLNGMDFKVIKVKEESK